MVSPRVKAKPGHSNKRPHLSNDLGYILQAWPNAAPRAKCGPRRIFCGPLKILRNQLKGTFINVLRFWLVNAARGAIFFIHAALGCGPLSKKCGHPWCRQTTKLICFCVKCLLHYFKAITNIIKSL